MPLPDSPPLKLRSLPIIDISPWIHPQASHHRGHNGGRRSTAAALHAACLTYGFFYLDISSYTDPDQTDDLATLARQFFALPEDEKQKLALSNQDGARGYQRLKENVTNGKADNHEGLDFYAPVDIPDKSKPLWGENQWPTDEQVPSFKTKFELWIDKMKKLGMIVMEAMSVGLGMTPDEWQELRSKVDDSFWVMRIIGYPPLPNDYDGFSCGAHKDYGCLTFLYADPTPNALQVFLPQPELLDDAATAPIPANTTYGLAPSASSLLSAAAGAVAAVTTNSITPPPPTETRLDPSTSSESGEQDSALDRTDSVTDELPKEEGEEAGVWINADPLPGCVVCNIGEMWEVWTNGLYKATLHRVVHRGSNYRVSIPFFFEPNFNARVEPLPAALRLQENTIQSAYAYHTSHTPTLKHSRVSSSDSLLSSSSSSGGLIPLSTHSTGGALTADSLSNGGSGARSPHPPSSVEKIYDPVVYGEFLLNKVGNNFTTGKKY